MPVIIINMIEGRTDKQKENLIREVTRSAAGALGEPEKSFHIIINEVPRANWGIEGTQFSKRKPTN